MKSGIPAKGMWVVFSPSFRKHLQLLGSAPEQRSELMKKAKRIYYEIVNKIPEYGKNDILFTTILSAAILASVYICLDKKPSVGELTSYYETANNDSIVMQIILKRTNVFSKKYQKKLKADAKKSQHTTNPYTWRYKFLAGPTSDSYAMLFDKCGIYNLMKDLGISEITPAMCAYDYGMAKITNTVFTREYTLASGGPVCDCHYQKKN